MSKLDMKKLVSHASTNGFVYQGSEIYDGLANSWDYGPLGVELKNNIKKAWWKRFVQESPYNVGLDSAILMNSRVWEASGHVGGFSDPLMDCKQCGHMSRCKISSRNIILYVHNVVLVILQIFVSFN